MCSTRHAKHTTPWVHTNACKQHSEIRVYLLCAQSDVHTHMQTYTNPCDLRDPDKGSALGIYGIQHRAKIDALRSGTNGSEVCLKYSSRLHNDMDMPERIQVFWMRTCVHVFCFMTHTILNGALNAGKQQSEIHTCISLYDAHNLERSS